MTSRVVWLLCFFSWVVGVWTRPELSASVLTVLDTFGLVISALFFAFLPLIVVVSAFTCWLGYVARISRMAEERSL